MYYKLRLHWLSVAHSPQKGWSTGELKMKYRFKAVKYSQNIDLFDSSYNSHNAAMQAAFAYVDLYVENSTAVDKLIETAVDDNCNTRSLSFTHDDTTYIVEPDLQ